jgi:hypothetical protein
MYTRTYEKCSYVCIYIYIHIYYNIYILYIYVCVERVVESEMPTFIFPPARILESFRRASQYAHSLERPSFSSRSTLRRLVSCRARVTRSPFSSYSPAGWSSKVASVIPFWHGGGLKLGQLCFGCTTPPSCRPYNVRSVPNGCFCHLHIAWRVLTSQARLRLRERRDEAG